MKQIPADFVSSAQYSRIDPQAIFFDPPVKVNNGSSLPGKRKIKNGGFLHRVINFFCHRNG